MHRPMHLPALGRMGRMAARGPSRYVKRARRRVRVCIPASVRIVVAPGGAMLELKTNG